MTRKEIEDKLNEVIRQQADSERLIAILKEAILEHDEVIPDSPVFNDQERVFFVNEDLNARHWTLLADPGTLPFNSFHTGNEAVEFSNMCRWNAMLLHCRHYLCPDYTPDWETDDDEYPIYLNTAYEKPKFEVDFAGHQFFNYNCVYFPSIDIAHKAADWMNKHWDMEDDTK